MFTYIYMYRLLDVCACGHTYMHTYVQSHLHTYLDAKYACIHHACLATHIQTYTHMYIRCSCIFTYIHNIYMNATYTYAFIHACMYICMQLGT